MEILENYRKRVPYLVLPRPQTLNTVIERAFNLISVYFLCCSGAARTMPDMEINTHMRLQISFQI